MSTKAKRTHRKIKRREMRRSICYRLKEVSDCETREQFTQFAIRAQYHRCFRIDWDCEPKPRIVLGKLLGRPVESIPFLRDALLANADRLIENRERGLEWISGQLGIRGVSDRAAVTAS